MSRKLPAFRSREKYFLESPFIDQAVTLRTPAPGILSAIGMLQQLLSGPVTMGSHRASGVTHVTDITRSSAQH